ncbi:myogenesis-regulating glycosidase isoform X1 [Calliphora vicina]|uniref:myogenesis-regulating glycosidase isoform X1 n=2 Tax=Calliphora vicina TaxID=7373 RepID=UPI00325ABCF3
MNTIQEESEQRVPLMLNSLREIKENSNIPYADENSQDDCPPSRKVSLSSRRNIELSLLIENDQPAVTDSGNNSPKTASDESTAVETPPLPLPRGLRRNSISMPSGINAIEDLEALRLKHQMQEQEPMEEEEKSNNSRTDSVIDDISGSVTFSVPEKNVTTIQCEKSEEESDDELEIHGKRRDRFRTRRRASIAPLPALRLNDKEMLASDFDAYSVASNQASITSVNSLASLLREKMQAFPNMIRKKKRETKDYKIKIFVILMFFMVIFLIGFAYVGYQRKILTFSYFDKIKFNSKDRILRILNHDEEEVISGQLGKMMNMDTQPFHCLEDNLKQDGSVCLEWHGIARLYMNFQDMDVFRCYTLNWQSLREAYYPTDCFELKRNNGLWFGGGITRNMNWSLSESDFDFAPFSSGDMKVHQFGNGIKRYFINSIGVAIQVSDKTPLHIAVNATTNEFCLRARNDDYTFVNKLTPMPELNYKICTTEDMKSLHMLMTQQSLWDGLKEADMKILHSLIEEPVWQIPHQPGASAFNETSIYNYSEDVIAMGFMRLGHILVNEFWQEYIGDFTVDASRFPTLKDTIDVLHRRGFKIVFTIQPFISTDSDNFKEAVRKKLLIYERHSERSIPALTRYKSCSSAGVLDITNNATAVWLKEKLQKLKQEYKVDSFYLDLGTGFNLPHYYQCRQTLDNPDMYARIFTESLESIGFIGVSTASIVPKPPAFLSTPPINSSWAGLNEVMSTVLSYGVIGYPFVLPGAIGGDYGLNRTMTKMLSYYSLGQPALPEQDLYIRWLQLMTFMPSLQFNHLPSEYKSDYITEIAKELTTIRQKYVIPLLLKYLSESMNEGLPLVRPLWMLDPHDPACLSIYDEFSVGEEMIVAPILEKDSEEREVYLPQGVWKDGIDGSLRKGSRWIHNYKVAKEKIAYFIKMPDNTRF